jgi:hypothetical protein
MTFDQIFAAYYTQYRAEATAPLSTDDEYTIAIRFANDGIARWANFDGTYWNELFTTAQTNSTGATLTVATGTKTYAAPTAMREAGGFVRVLDTNGTTLRTYPILQPNEAQFQGDNATYAYFTGTVSGGFTLHLNPAPDAAINGKSLDYVYYKKASEFSTGATETTEMGNPYFLVHHMLAARFRASRNWSGYQTAKRDAESALQIMQQDNNSGSWANPWKLTDTSGAQFGASSGGSGSFF